MEQQSLRILIAEDQMFIALEAERIIKSTHPCEVDWCRRADLQTALGQARYDIVILEAAENMEDLHERVAAIRQAGADLVILHPAQEGTNQYTEFRPAAVVEKPFYDAQLTGFLRSYLDRKEPTA